MILIAVFIVSYHQYKNICTRAHTLRRFFTSKGKPDRSALWSMNLISEYIDPYTLIKFIDHNADRSGLPLLVKKRLYSLTNRAVCA